ncbi:hypothetical protein M9H77_22788 [Catharanthus roseus]|uniref:Uncharacterized protein n=1 Tax=Catharanthus roseus TaxID=4058 RepID=A0ACC0ASZ2_CATRO|nr:hypothetical protein M9H77_22788 [Catharanthus roseus]
MNEKLCSCGKCQEYTLLCSNALAVCKDNGTRLDAYVADIYSKSEVENGVQDIIIHCPDPYSSINTGTDLGTGTDKIHPLYSPTKDGVGFVYQQNPTATRNSLRNFSWRRKVHASLKTKSLQQLEISMTFSLMFFIDLALCAKLQFQSCGGLCFVKNLAEFLENFNIWANRYLFKRPTRYTSLPLWQNRKRTSGKLKATCNPTTMEQEFRLSKYVGVEEPFITLKVPNTLRKDTYLAAFFSC